MVARQNQLQDLTKTWKKILKKSLQTPLKNIFLPINIFLGWWLYPVSVFFNKYIFFISATTVTDASPPRIKAATSRRVHRRQTTHPSCTQARRPSRLRLLLPMYSHPRNWWAHIHTRNTHTISHSHVAHTPTRTQTHSHTHIHSHFLEQTCTQRHPRNTHVTHTYTLTLTFSLTNFYTHTLSLTQSHIFFDRLHHLRVHTHSHKHSPLSLSFDRSVDEGMLKHLSCFLIHLLLSP